MGASKRKLRKGAAATAKRARSGAKAGAYDHIMDVVGRGGAVVNKRTKAQMERARDKRRKRRK